MKNILKPLAGIALAVSACLANAAAPTVIDFNKASGSFLSYVEDGYRLTGPTGLTATPAGKGNETFTTSGFLFNAIPLGTPFDLLSLDLGNTGTKTSGGVIDLFYTVAGEFGVHSEKLTLDNLSGLQTFTQSLTDITSFTLVGENRLKFQVDNIDVTPYSKVSAVPEPGSIALLIAGLGMLGIVARRRKA